MRSLIISIISIILVITSWSFFGSYSDRNIHKLMNEIDNGILVSVYEKDWRKAEDQFNAFSERWHNQKKTYSFFFNSADINEADYSIARTKNYIHARDISLASGELNCIKEQLNFLHQNELITLDNVF